VQAKEKDQLNTEDYTKGMMESSMGIDMGLLDLDLLQLPDLPSSPSPSSSSTSPKHSLSHARLDDLFAQWLSLPDTQRLVMSLLEEAKSAGSSPLAQVSPSVSVSLLPGVFKEGSTPPLSPKSSPLSPRSPMRRSGSGPSNLSSPLRKSSDPLREVIPQFYFPDGPPASREMASQCLARIDQIFAGHPDGLPASAFMTITKEICKLPSFFSGILFKNLDVNSTGLVKR
jgi:serine/threonine-protein phosphatase 2A regulatory subunit B''